MAIADFEDVWAATGFWALLVLPSENVVSTIFDAVSPTVLDLGAPGDACGGLVSESVRLGRAGDLAGAETRLATAMTLCPLDSAVWRELAGIRFLQSRWRESSRLASHAVTLDPSDGHAWELLASSRYLAEDPIGALEAWNHVGRPRIDIVRVEGAHRTRHPVVAELLDLPARSLLTPAMVRRASRRLRELPAAADSRVRYRLDDSGLAQVDAVIVERPVVPRGIVSIAAAAGQALVRRELRLDIAGPSGSGELWSAAWRWWAGRPRVGFELAVPSGGRLPGKTTLEASWEEQSYAHVGQVPTGTAAGTVVRQSRRRAGVRVADWATHALRWDLSGAFDRWDSESHAALSAGLDLRLAQDRVSLGVEASGWAPLEKGARFGRSEVTLGWRSSARDEGPAAWSATVGAAAATRAAPRGLWAGAGTGHARTPLLRAHPLLDDGVIQGPAFGRRLAYGSLEYHRPVWIRLWKLGFGAFVDTARAWDRDEPRGAMRLHVDAGVGVRLSVPGIRGSARIDLARGVRDGRLALSAAWQSPWPGR